MLDARRNNYLVAIVRARASAPDAASLFALAALDISTAEFRVMECDRLALAAEIARIEPGEIIVSDALYGDADLAPWLRELPVTPLTRDVFDGATAERRLAGYFAVATTEAFGAFSRLELTAAAACVTYVERTQLGTARRSSPPTREAAGASLMIDAATRANLELMRTLAGERRGSLLAAIDRTVTAAGARLLSQRLAAPLTDPAEIARRLDAVARFVTDAASRADVRDQSLPPHPILRARSRASCSGAAVRAISRRSATGSRRPPHLRRGSARSASSRTELGGCGTAHWRRRIRAIAAALRAALADELPLYEARRRLRSRRLRCGARRDARACATNRAAWSPPCRRAMPTRPACAR